MIRRRRSPGREIYRMPTTRDLVLPGVDRESIAESDPREAAKLVARLSNAEAQATATAAIAWQWAGSDPQAASKWARLFSGKQRPAASF